MNAAQFVIRPHANNARKLIVKETKDELFF